MKVQKIFFPQLLSKFRYLQKQQTRNGQKVGRVRVWTAWAIINKNTSKGNFREWIWFCERRLAPLPALQVMCLPVTAADYLFFFFFPCHRTKECIVGKPSWHMTLCKGGSQREAASRGLLGLDALLHSMGLQRWVSLPTKALVQFAQLSWERTVKLLSKPSCKHGWGKKSESKRACTMHGKKHKRRWFKRAWAKEEGSCEGSGDGAGRGRGRKLNPNVRSRRESLSNVMEQLAPQWQERSGEVKCGKTLDGNAQLEI